MSTTNIQLKVAAHFKLSLEEILGTGRDPKLVIARHVAWHIEREHGMSTIKIGAMYQRDSSTIVYATNHMRERVSAGDVRYVPHIAAVETMLTLSEKQGAVMSCPTCGSSVLELQRQIAEIHRKISERR